MERASTCEYPIWNVRMHADVPLARKIEYKQIVECEPFCLKDGIETTTVIDLDGFFLHGGDENNFKDNLKRLMALKGVVANSSEVIFWSSRIGLDQESVWGKLLLPIFESKSMTNFPFMSDKSRERLKQFAEKANPDCKIDFRMGLKKTVGNGDHTFEQEIVERIGLGKRVAVLGSSIFDRIFVKRISTSLTKNCLSCEKLYLFDSGKLIV